MNLLRKILSISLIIGIIYSASANHPGTGSVETICNDEHFENENDDCCTNFASIFSLIDHSTDLEDNQHKHDFPSHHHCSSSCVSLVSYLPANSLFATIPVTHCDSSTTLKITYNPQFSLSDFASSIWQPPQVG